MTTTTDTRTGIDYTTALAILPTLHETQPDDDCPGMVGDITGSGDHRAICAELRAAGYEVSDSRDDDGRRWIWVVRDGSAK